MEKIALAFCVPIHEVKVGKNTKEIVIIEDYNRNLGTALNGRCKIHDQMV